MAKQITAVKGYKQIRLCHMVLKHLQQLLALAPLKTPTHRRSQLTASTDSFVAHSQHGTQETQHTTETATQTSCSSAVEAEARRFLSRMCEERLMPTYWLNEVSIAVVNVVYGCASKDVVQSVLIHAMLYAMPDK